MAYVDTVLQTVPLTTMKNEYTNRLTMFQTALGILQDPDHTSIWQGQPPLIFTDKVNATEVAVGALEDFCQQQGVTPTGTTLDKSREQKHLIEAAFSLGRALVTWFTDQNNLTDAAKVDFTRSDWNRFRNEDMLAKAKLVKSLADDLTAVPDAVKYDITAGAVNDLDSAITAFADYLTAPQQAISTRKSLTDQLRDRFNAVETMFGQLDDMILRFNKTAAGQAMIAAYHAARIVRDLGHGPSATPPTPPAPATGSK